MPPARLAAAAQWVYAASAPLPKDLVTLKHHRSIDHPIQARVPQNIRYQWMAAVASMWLDQRLYRKLVIALTACRDETSLTAYARPSAVSIRYKAIAGLKAMVSAGPVDRLS